MANAPLPKISLMPDDLYNQVLAMLQSGETSAIDREDGVTVHFELKGDEVWEMPTDVLVAPLSRVKKVRTTRTKKTKTPK